MPQLKSIFYTLILTVALITLIFVQLNHTRAAQPATSLPEKTAVLITTTTPLDFYFPGTQPNMLTHNLTDPQACAGCHAGFSDMLGQPQNNEPWFGWSGSMMAHSARDPLFYAALDIANADAAFAGEYCLRCHVPRGWLNGRSATPDGSAMTAEDLEGVQCALCHRMVDPVPAAENPTRDTAVLAALTPTQTITTTGSGSFIIDPLDHRRGPFDVAADLGNFDPHTAIGAQETLQSPFHQEALFCGSCHDVNNPLFTWDENSQSYQPNPPNTPADPATMFPLERTFSEWENSAYNTAQGVYAPQFGGNKSAVSTCQDCHMRDVTGVGAVFFDVSNPAPTRTDLPLHDLTGANTWVPQLLPLHPVFSGTFTTGLNAQARQDALAAGIDRARYMLQNAATLSASFDTGSGQLTVTIVNQTGHKLPTGYPEGRRMWLQIVGYDANGAVVYQSGAYDAGTAVLTTDPDLTLYEAKHGLTSDWAAQLGMAPGATFHFALNNTIISDNRIPPRGYTFAAFQAAGAAPYTNGQPDPTRYADGQYWDTAVYTLPSTVVTGTVRLLHQVASKEYVEFLRDNNPSPGDPNSRGNILYDLWQVNPSPPEMMAELVFYPETAYLPVVIRP